MISIKDVLARFNTDNANKNPLEVAIAVFQTPDGQRIVEQARRENEWHWQDWLHKHGDYKYHEFRPAKHITDAVALDWKLRQKYCTNCNGRKCEKYNNPWFLATLEQLRFGKQEDTDDNVINYLIWQPCIYATKQISQRSTEKSRNVRSDYL